MSFSKPKLQNPAKKFIQWSSKNQAWQWYDKETEKNKTIKTPAYFIVLDRLQTITGFTNGKEGSGIYSNEVHDLNREQLIVRSFDNFVHIAGYWNQIKDSVKAAGGKYAQSVYCVMVGKDMEPELVNIKFTGASRDPFFKHKFKDQDVIILTPEFTQSENRGTIFFVPEIKKSRMNEDQRTKYFDICYETDIKLQEYLSSKKQEYLNADNENDFSAVDKARENYENPPVPEEFPDAEEVDYNDVSDNLPF